MRPVHPFQRRVFEYIRQEQLIAETDSILAAVSGGPDSVALLHVLVSLRELCGITQIAVLHFDHQLRGGASAADKAFVEVLAKSLGLVFHTASEDVRSYQKRQRISLEMAARICRHRFFRDALARLGAKAIALGHTANDQAEELLLRLFRGTGPSGMSGMLPKTADRLVRPILFATRSEILAYLHDQKLSFREDSSNLDPSCQRNALRHEVFPFLEKHFHPRVVKVLCRHGRLVRDEESFWTDLLTNHWQAVCVGENDSRIVLNSEALSSLHQALRRRVLRFALKRLRGSLPGIYAVHIEALCKLLAHRAPGRLIQLPGGLSAGVEGELLVLSKESRGVPPVDEQEFFQTIRGPGSYQFSSFELCLSLKEVPSPAQAGPFPETADMICLDAGRIKWPLFLRLWKWGDRFHPLGLGGSKKLQDFFVDLKISRSERSRVLLLCDQEKICWVVGYRLDDRVKVTPQTKHLLTIEKLPTTAPD